MACPQLLPFALALIFLSLSFQPSSPRTVVVNGVAKSPVPALHVGDSVVFTEVDLYDLYIFHSKKAFDLCIYAQASLLHSTGGNLSSYYTWHPSGPGNYYFSYKNRSLDACERGKRIQVTVLLASVRSPALSPLPSPPPASGDDGGNFFPSLPHARRFISPSPSPGASLPLPGNGRSRSAGAPLAFPGSSSGLPFISSNPALPLPTGDADAATSRPLPVTGGSGRPLAGKGLAIQMAALPSLVVAFALWGI